MRDEPFLPRRRSVRLRDFDYSQPGAYFLTVCARDKKPLFGKVTGSAVALSPLGHIANDCWLSVPRHFPHVDLGPHVVMPDHVHGIIVISRRRTEHPPKGTERSATADGHTVAKDLRRARHAVPLREKGLGEFAVPVAGSIPALVGAFKAAVSRRARLRFAKPGESIWQRGYYEHVLWDGEDFQNACEYIRTNPARRAIKQEQ